MKRTAERDSKVKEKKTIIKRVILYLTVAVMLMTACGAGAAAAQSPDGQLTIQDIQALNGGKAVIHTRDGLVTFVGGTCSATPVKNAADANGVVEKMIPLMGGDARTRFEPWRVLKDSFGNNYYVFQQVFSDTVVQGGAVKVITDSEGTMRGLTGSVVTDLPEGETAAGISAKEAEAAVLKHEQESSGVVPALMEGTTKKIVLPVDRELDLEAEEILSRFVWAVFTTNPSGNAAREFPYLAHYVTMSGEYLYSLPTQLPGDNAGSAGYHAEYAFDNMEPVSYTGYVDLSDGTEKELTVTVMRDRNTGTYYLGDPERRILVADCWEFLYNHGNVVAESSPDNREWDQVSLMSLYNYGRAYDYYRAIGWSGADGADTPILILKDFCDEEHHPVDNAAYAGKFYGWQCFLSSSANDFAQSLDVLAHEFTHCVTDSVMTYNAYINDFGAINEAMSDIQGNLCEMMAGDTEDRTWKIAENSGKAIRSMSEPRLYQQPEYTWDLYYHAGVQEATAANDNGGVHSNSSLLSRTAYLLWEAGMTTEEARAYWFAVDCAMTPGTDYAELTALLPEMLRITGLGNSMTALEQAISGTRMGKTELPAGPAEGQALLTLELPDTEAFNNGKWTLTVLSLNAEKLLEKVTTVLQDLNEGRTDGYPAILRGFFEEGKETDDSAGKAGAVSFAEALAEAISEMGKEEEQPSAEGKPDKAKQDDPGFGELREWLLRESQGIFYNGNAAAGQDGHTVRMMAPEGRALPALVYIDPVQNSDRLAQLNVVAWIGGRWADLTPVLSCMTSSETNLPGVIGAAFRSGLVFDLLGVAFTCRNAADWLDALTVKIREGETVTLSSEGLEYVTLSANMANPALEAEVTVNSRKSRPKE